jgi:hypothetical protein
MEGFIWSGLVSNAEIIQSKGGEKWSTKKENYFHWSNLVWELPSKMHC